MAARWGATEIHLGANEPLLTFEFSLETAWLAKAHGYTVTMDTNRFSTPSVVEAIAPYIDMVYVGIKGNLDPDFCDLRMRAPGAVPAVLASLKAWRDSPTMLAVSDVTPPPHWVDDEDFESNAASAYTWIAEHIGPLTLLEIYAMINPRRYENLSGQPMLPRAATPDDRRHFYDRWGRAVEIARASGLAYAYKVRPGAVYCHSCAGVLRNNAGVGNVTAGRCVHCGVEVSIVPRARDGPEAGQKLTE